MMMKIILKGAIVVVPQKMNHVINYRYLLTPFL